MLMPQMGLANQALPLFHKNALVRAHMRTCWRLFLSLLLMHTVVNQAYLIYTPVQLTFDTVTHGLHKHTHTQSQPRSCV